MDVAHEVQDAEGDKSVSPEPVYRRADEPATTIRS
jgi:hypothetical protein